MSITVNELSVITFTIVPLNEADVAFVPVSARYRIDDIVSGNPVIAWTSVTPSASIAIEIPATAHIIIDPSQQIERKMFTFSSDDGTAQEHNEQIEYQVRNLAFVS